MADRVNRWILAYLLLLPIVSGYLVYQARAGRLAIEHENAVWRTMVDQIPGGVCKLSADSGVILYCNDGFLNIIGRKRRDVVGSKVWEIDLFDADYTDHHKVFATDLEFHRSNLGHALKATGPIRRSDGAKTIHDIVIQPYYDDKGNPKWVVFTSPPREKV